jgi:hypothetical protein
MKNLVYGIFAALFIFVSNASAELTLPTALDVGDVETVAGLVIAGLAVMWGIRKVIKLTNRS